jgi:Spx/MgsR family transcriptional regulator
MMTLTMFGIPNCDTVKKARVWLDVADIGYQFHDYKKLGIDAETLNRWCDALGWTTVLNRAGTSFKKLPEADKTDLDQTKAIALMIAQPSMIKRPIVEGDGVLLAGFKPELYGDKFAR